MASIWSLAEESGPVVSSRLARDPTAVQPTAVLLYHGRDIHPETKWKPISMLSYKYIGDKNKRTMV